VPCTLRFVSAAPHAIFAAAGWSDGRDGTELQGDVRALRRDAAHAAILRVHRTAAPPEGRPRPVLWPARDGKDDADPAGPPLRLLAGGDPAVAGDLRHRRERGADAGLDRARRPADRGADAAARRA